MINLLINICMVIGLCLNFGTMFYYMYKVRSLSAWQKAMDAYYARKHQELVRMAKGQK